MNNVQVLATTKHNATKCTIAFFWGRGGRATASWRIPLTRSRSFLGITDQSPSDATTKHNHRKGREWEKMTRGGAEWKEVAPLQILQTTALYHTATDRMAMRLHQMSLPCRLQQCCMSDTCPTRSESYSIADPLQRGVHRLLRVIPQRISTPRFPKDTIHGSMHIHRLGRANKWGEVATSKYCPQGADRQSDIHELGRDASAAFRQRVILTSCKKVVLSLHLSRNALQVASSFIGRVFFFFGSLICSAHRPMGRCTPSARHPRSPSRSWGGSWRGPPSCHSGVNLGQVQALH